MKKVHCRLFHNPTEITSALVAVAGQEGNDGPEYDLMMEAADYIRELHGKLENVINTFQDELRSCIPVMREFARNNPRHEHNGVVQDPCGVHAWLGRNDSKSDEQIFIVKPCPFCGLQMQDSDSDDYLHPVRRPVSKWISERFWSINCLECAGGCGVQMLGDTEEDVVQKWNRRVK